ncbi:uncharacterized protein METZ01_LOCUS359222, partial [marine metagenome]
VTSKNETASSGDPYGDTAATKTELNPGFQVNVDVAGRACLVVGGSGEAEDKSGRLLTAGAAVTIVSPEVTPSLQGWAEQGRLNWHRRGFDEADLEGVFMVMNTDRANEEFCRRVYDLAHARGILTNTYDRMDLSDFGMAALIAPGHLRLSISTSNASPSLARRLREELEELFDEEFEDYLESLGKVRAHVRVHVGDFGERRRILRSLVEGFRLEGRLRLPPDWQRQADEAMAVGNTQAPRTL